MTRCDDAFARRLKRASEEKSVSINLARKGVSRVDLFRKKKSNIKQTNNQTNKIDKFPRRRINILSSNLSLTATFHRKMYTRVVCCKLFPLSPYIRNTSTISSYLYANGTFLLKFIAVNALQLPPLLSQEILHVCHFSKHIIWCRRQNNTFSHADFKTSHVTLLLQISGCERNNFVKSSKSQQFTKSKHSHTSNKAQLKSLYRWGLSRHD